MKALKRAGSLILALVLLVCAVPVSAFAASDWPSLSERAYAEYQVPGQVNVYANANLTKRGTQSPYKEYNARIDAGDIIHIYAINATSCIFRYPAGNSYRIGYAKTSTLFGVSTPAEAFTAKAKVNTYTGASTASRTGSTAIGDQVFKLGTVKASPFTLILYTAVSDSRSFKAAFVTNTDYQKLKGGASQSTVITPPAGALTNPVSGSFVRIRYSLNNRYLDVPAEGISRDGTQLQLWDYAPGNQNQFFQLTDTGAGWRITSLQSGKVIEVRDSSHSDCAQVAQWAKHDLACARWDIIKNGDGTVSFRNRESGKYLNVCGGGDAGNGTKIIQYHNDKSYAMKFFIEPISISGYTTTTGTIQSSQIKREKDLSIRSWHPLNGLTRAMYDQEGTPESDIKLPASVEAFNTKVDAFGFILSWISNASEVTRIHATEGKNGKISLRYGTTIEQIRSGKSMSLSNMLIEAHRGEAAYFLWADSDADECVRSWFGLSGPGKYNIYMTFGKVKYGDYGYALTIDNGAVYQTPLIHPDSFYGIYYKENKQTQFVMDAAEVLRNAKLPLTEDEARTVVIQLIKNGYIK